MRFMKFLPALRDNGDDRCRLRLAGLDFDRVLAATLGTIHGLVSRVDQLAHVARRVGRNQQRAMLHVTE